MNSNTNQRSIEELICIAAAFNVAGTPSEVRPIGNGHINDTYLVICRADRTDGSSRVDLDDQAATAGSREPTVRRYILQRINHDVFTRPDDLMKNITKVTEHLKDKVGAEGGDPDRETFTVISLRNAGEPETVISLRDTGVPEQGMRSTGNSVDAGLAVFRNAADGTFWRMITFIEDSFTCEKAGDCESTGRAGGAQPTAAENSHPIDLMYEAGFGYGRFMQRMADFPADELCETIPGFHDTRRRYDDLMRACEADVMGRASEVTAELSCIREHEQDTDILNSMVRDGKLPLRVTHNDTKLSNILFDKTSGRAICVIDLDTVMPGLSVTDFGDAIRSGAATAGEDEHDPAKVSLDLNLYRSFLKGFTEGFPDITQQELEMLPFGAKVMTLECGMRFLTDYLEGDTYFKTDHPGHNLERCRAQLALVRDIERKWDELKCGA